MSEHRIELAYGRATRVVDLPEDVSWQIPDTGQGSSPPLDRASIARALEEPTHGPSLPAVLDGAESVVIALPDRTRVAGLSRLVPVILEHVAAQIASSAPIAILSGGGTHVPDDPAAVLSHVPRDLRKRLAVGVHDARDGDAHVELGTTSRGTHVSLDRRVVEGAPAVIVVGAIGFHYFAGFAGGRKGIFPGLAAYESVRQNHRLVLAERGGGLDPRCRPGVLDGNPVHEDMLEAARLLPGPVFLVNALTDAHGEVVDVYSGELAGAHAVGCRAYGEIHTLSLSARFDMLVADAGGHPRDIDLIQAHKSLVHASPALKRGGALVVVAECAEGIGSKTFLPWFAHASSSAMEAALREDYQLNSHTALSFRSLTEQYEVFMVTSLEERLVETLGANPCATPVEALARARATLGGSRTGVVLRAPTGVWIHCQEDRT